MKKSLLISQSLISQLWDSARKLLIIKKKKEEMDLSNQNIKKTNKSFNEPKSWTQGKKLRRNGKKERMSPHSLTLLTSCNLDYSSSTRDAKMLILGNPSVKLNPRYACKNARTLGDYLWIPMISFRGRAKRERERDNRVYDAAGNSK